MSARAFAGIPKQFAKAARFQRASVPKMTPRLWKAQGSMYEAMNGATRTMEFSSRQMRSLVYRFRCTEMRRIQIGALYNFSYISKEFLELLQHFEQLLDEEELEDEEQRTTLTGRQLSSF